MKIAHRVEAWAREMQISFEQILLIAYALVLPIRKTASLQAILLILAFVILLWKQRKDRGLFCRDALWIAAPLLVFSAWVFGTAFFWPGAEGLQQPWFSLDQWRRDIGQPLLAMVCAYRAFRHPSAKYALFFAHGILIFILAAKGFSQFFLGEFVFEGYGWILLKGTFQVRGFSRDNIFFSYVLLLLVPGALWLITDLKFSERKWLKYGILLTLLILIFINKRRGTWIAVSCEAFFLSLWLGKRYFFNLLIGAFVVVIFAFAVKPHWFYRDYDKKSFSRLQIMRDLPPLLKERPWVGVGFGKDTVVKNYWSRIYQHAHNTFANLALGVGFPGLAIWIAALIVYGRRFWKGSSLDWSSRIGLLLLIGFCVRNLTDDVWVASNAELFWFLIGVLMPSRIQLHEN